MNRNDQSKTFMMITNLKNPLVIVVVYTVRQTVQIWNVEDVLNC